MKVLFTALLVFTVIMTSFGCYKTITFYSNQSEKHFNSWQDERDCRFSLEMFVRRNRGENFPKRNYDLCDLDPLQEICSCGKILKERKNE